MPFDFMPTQPLLDPSVRDLPPRQRLIRLRDWLYAGGPGEAAWYYPTRMNLCGTVGCAMGWYEHLTGEKRPDEDYLEVEFGISHEAAAQAFVHANAYLEKPWGEVTPRDVANVIDLVLRGEIA